MDRESTAIDGVRALIITYCVAGVGQWIASLLCYRGSRPVYRESTMLSTGQTSVSRVYCVIDGVRSLDHGLLCGGGRPVDCESTVLSVG